METLTGCAILLGVLFPESSLSIDFGLIMVREEKQSLSGLGEQPLRTRYESEQALWLIVEQFTSLWLATLVILSPNL